MFGRFVIRDLGLLLLTLLLWALSLGAESSTFLASVLGVSAGIGAVICAYTVHEWGHLVAALWTDSVFTPAKRILSPFLFSYDTKHNTPKQFLTMSLGGFAATAVLLTAFILWMPQEPLAGRIALHGGLFLAALGAIIELPIFFRALFGRTVPRTGLFEGPTVGGNRRKLRRST